MNLILLREIRKQRGYSQETMARRMDISHRGYSIKERGEQEFTVTQLLQVAEILEIDPCILIKNKEREI